MRLSLNPAVPGRPLAVLAGSLLAACAVSGHGPLWMAAVWALALGLWCLSERRRSLVLAVPVLLALLPAWPLHSNALAFTGLYLPLALVGLAAALFVQTLDERAGWWGLAALGLAWAFAPTPLGLFGLLGAALLRAQAVQRGARQAVSGRALGALLASVVVVALASALLPRPAWSGSPQPPPPVQQPRAAPEAQGPAPTVHPVTPGRAPSHFAPLPPLASFALLDRLSPFVLAAVALLCSTVLLLALRERRQRQEGSRIEEIVLAAALGVGYLMLLLYALARQGGVGSGGAGAARGLAMGGGAAGAAGQTKIPAGLVALLNALGWAGVGATLLFLALAAVGLVLLWRARLAAPADPRRTSAPPAPDPGGSPEHRVRRAYRLMLAALATAGLARTGAETPQEFLGRLAAQRPEVAASARTITAAYEPVRYGAQTDESGAQAAEAALAQLQQLLAPGPGAA